MSKPFETGAHASAFGERLRREREMRGISIDEVAAATKIGTRLLRALEAGQFDLLPGGIFNKNYVRAYARHLGINEEEAVAGYLQAAHESPPDVRLIAHQHSAARADYFGHSPSSVFGGFPLVPVLILVVVVTGAAGGLHLYRQRQRERQRPPIAFGAPPPATQAPARGSAEPMAPSPPASGGSGSEAPASAGASGVSIPTVEAAENSMHSAGSNAATETSSPFEVTVRAKGRARVEIRSDGEIVVRGVIEPPDVKTFHATKRLVFWTANGGDVELSFNGVNVPVSGGENDEQVLVFNSHGLMPRPAAQ